MNTLCAFLKKGAPKTLNKKGFAFRKAFFVRFKRAAPNHRLKSFGELFQKLENRFLKTFLQITV
ncbi:MAG: hypothetical protein J6C75_08040, partial [Oscillospiraceae bacterium]|nr:hypothetical protein [Oscillospiraceae bacterium]